MSVANKTLYEVCLSSNEAGSGRLERWDSIRDIL